LITTPHGLRPGNEAQRDSQKEMILSGLTASESQATDSGVKMPQCQLQLTDYGDEIMKSFLSSAQVIDSEESEESKKDSQKELVTPVIKVPEVMPPPIKRTRSSTGKSPKPAGALDVKKQATTTCCDSDDRSRPTRICV